MKRFFFPLIFLLSLSLGLVLNSCYTDTVDSFSTFSFQFPILFHADHHNKISPDTSTDFVNLYDYPEYTDNKHLLNKAEILSFNYRIDSLQYTPPGETDTTIFDPNSEEHKNIIQFDFIRFTLVFAKLKSEFLDVNDENSYEEDTTIAPQLLGEFYDVKIEDYYRYAHHIEVTDEKVAQVISNSIKERPHFYIVTEYSKLSDQTEGEDWKFPYIESNYDMVVRFNIDL